MKAESACVCWKCSGCDVYLGPAYWFGAAAAAGRCERSVEWRTQFDSFKSCRCWHQWHWVDSWHCRQTANRHQPTGNTNRQIDTHTVRHTYTAWVVRTRQSPWSKYSCSYIRYRVINIKPSVAIQKLHQLYSDIQWYTQVNHYGQIYSTILYGQ